MLLVFCTLKECIAIIWSTANFLKNGRQRKTFWNNTLCHIPQQEITFLLRKIFSFCCFWKLDGNNFINLTVQKRSKDFTVTSTGETGLKVNLSLLSTTPIVWPRGNRVHFHWPELEHSFTGTVKCSGIYFWFAGPSPARSDFPVIWIN